ARNPLGCLSASVLQVQLPYLPEEIWPHREHLSFVTAFQQERRPQESIRLRAAGASRLRPRQVSPKLPPNLEQVFPRLPALPVGGPLHPSHEHKRHARRIKRQRRKIRDHFVRWELGPLGGHEQGGQGGEV